MKAAGAALAAALAALAGCAGPTAATGPSRAPDFRPSELRQPAVFVRVVFAGDFGDAERAGLPAQYEGALLEALNQRAVLVRDARLVDRLPDPGAAAARAREVGADHAILVEVRVERGVAVFCRGGRRPFRAPVTVLAQTAEVYRARDGARRLGVEPSPAADLEEDCEEPRASRRRPPAEALGEAVNRLLTRLLGG